MSPERFGLQRWSGSHPGRARDAFFIIALMVLAAAAAKARSVGLDPETLWHDDVWVGALTRIDSLARALVVPNAAPPGFVAISWAMARLIADPEIALQAAPFAAGVLGILAAGWMGRVLTGSVSAGVALAALVVFNPHHVHFSVFVKQYTLEFLVVATAVAVVASDRWPERPGSLVVFVPAALVAASLGIGAAVAVVIAANIVLVSSIVRVRRNGESVRLPVFAAIAFNAAFATYAVGLVLPRAQPGLVSYWDGYYMPAAWPDCLEFLDTRGLAAVEGALPARATVLVWLAPLGLVALALQSRTRRVALLIAASMGAILVLSVLERYPIGGGRTDVYSFSLTLACVVAGGHALVRFVPRGRWLAGGIAVAALVLAVLRAPGERYFQLDQSRLARLFEVNALPGDGLVVYPTASYLVAFYTRLPVAPRFASDQPQWQMVLTQPNGLTLPFDDPAHGRRLLASFLERGRHQRVLYISARVSEAYPEADLIRAIEAAGFRERRRWTAKIRTSLILFDRVVP